MKNLSYLRYDGPRIFTIFETFAAREIFPTIHQFFFLSFLIVLSFPPSLSFSLFPFFLFFSLFFFISFYFDAHRKNTETHPSFDDASSKCKIDRCWWQLSPLPVQPVSGASCFWHDDLRRRSANMILHDWLFINSAVRASIYTALIYFRGTIYSRIRSNYSWLFWKRERETGGINKKIMQV